MKFWLILIPLILVFFKKSLSVTYILDDFSHLSLSAGVVNRSFFRPIPTELFYFLTWGNLLLAHLIVLVTFIISLIIFEKILRKFVNEKTAKIIIFLYALSSIHVFQLYWLATFQEVCLLIFSLLTTYFFINKKWLFTGVFFLLALLSKEQAIMLPIFLLTLTLFFPVERGKKSYLFLLFLFMVSVVFLIIVKSYIINISVLPEYRINLGPRLFINNLLWYSLWGIGFPSVLPDFLPSIFKPPLPVFSRFMGDLVFRLYFFPMLLFLVGVIAYSIKIFRKSWFKYMLFCLVSFLIFLLPVLPILHKWPVRLTIPLIFIAIAQGVVISKMKKPLILFFLTLYIFWNYWGVRFHEAASTYFFESAIVKSLERSLEPKNIFFKDSAGIENGWQGSKKIKLTVADQAFLKYFYPGENLHAYFDFEHPSLPKNYIIIDAQKTVNDAAKNIGK